MVDNDSQRSIQAYKTASRNFADVDVLVVATRQNDADTLCEILSRAGYVPHWYNGLAELSDLPGSAKATGNIVATILCHRTSLRSHDSNFDVINLPSQLPNKVRSKRLVVVSDCMDEQTVVALLDDGAHYCFSLLESPRVLQARLEAALRRHSRSPDQFLAQGDIHFDLQKRRVTRSGSVVELSPKEFELAYYLFSNRDRVVENGELLASIWSLPADMDTRRIDTAACRIRKKLSLSAANGWELRRLRRIGYRLVRTHPSDESESDVELQQEA